MNTHKCFPDYGLNRWLLIKLNNDLDHCVASTMYLNSLYYITVYIIIYYNKFISCWRSRNILLS